MTTVDNFYLNKISLLLKEGGIISLETKNPFRWTSGIISPINIKIENIMRLTKLRLKIFELTMDTICKADLEDSFDIVIAKSKEDIWIGKLIALRLDKPFILIKNGKAHRELEGLNQIRPYFQRYKKDIQSITSSSPEGISVGIEIAHINSLPFGYIVNNPKKPFEINGGIRNGKSFLIYHENNFQELKAISEKLGIHIVDSYHLENSRDPIEVDISGKKVLLVENLCTTMQSALKEINTIRKLGGIIENILTIINYGLPESYARADEANVQIHNTIHSNDFIKSGIKQGFIKEKEKFILKNFFSDPYHWAENNEFK